MTEEIRIQRKDLFSSQEQVKQARLEMEIHRQKSATRHTEDIINAMRSRGGRAVDIAEQRRIIIATRTTTKKRKSPDCPSPPSRSLRVNPARHLPPPPQANPNPLQGPPLRGGW